MTDKHDTENLIDVLREELNRTDFWGGCCKLENDTVRLVLVELNNIQAKCDVLAAENEFIRGEHEDSLGPYACVDLPATKVAIAEIKAQGVDELSSLCFISYNHQHPATEEFLGFCKQFAANLRAGIVAKDGE